MGKVLRKKVIIDCFGYRFSEAYENEMEFLEDKEVISITVIKSEERADYIREEYLVFYKD